MEPQSGTSPLLVTLLTVLVTAIIVSGGYYAVANKQATDSKNGLQSQVDTLKTKVAALPTATPTPIPTATPTPDPTKSTYINTKYGYSFTYPKADLAVTETATSATTLSPTAEIVGVLPAGDDISKAHTSVEVFEVATLPSITQFTKAALEGLMNHATGPDEPTPPISQTVSATTLNGVKAFKLDKSGYTFDIYFVQAPGGMVLELLPLIGNADATASLNSFTFTK